jgi:hypothetical protein
MKIGRNVSGSTKVDICSLNNRIEAEAIAKRITAAIMVCMEKIAFLISLFIS